MRNDARIIEIDIAKGINILLVIWGHLVKFNGFIWRWIFSFHMPFFFIMSGVCSKIQKETKFKRYFIRQVTSLLMISAISRIIFLLTGYAETAWSFKEAVLYLISPSSEWFCIMVS